MSETKSWVFDVDDMRGNPSVEQGVAGICSRSNMMNVDQQKFQQHLSLTEPLLDESLDIDPNVLSRRDQDEDEVLCCRCNGFGLRLSPFLLLLIFIYVNLLNYVDRGLVNGVLPTYCVKCPDQNSSIECSSHRSCMWDRAQGTVLVDSKDVNFLTESQFYEGICGFNQSVRPQLGIAGSFHLNETEQVSICKPPRCNPTAKYLIAAAQGILAGAFMGGYCVFSPIFAYLSSFRSPFKLMALGTKCVCIMLSLQGPQQF